MGTAETRYGAAVFMPLTRSPPQNTGGYSPMEEKEPARLPASMAPETQPRNVPSTMAVRPAGSPKGIFRFATNPSRITQKLASAT